MCGVRGDGAGIVIDPQFPSHWERCALTRTIRGARIDLQFERAGGGAERRIEIDGVVSAEGRIDEVIAGRTYKVRVSGG